MKNTITMLVCLLSMQMANAQINQRQLDKEFYLEVKNVPLESHNLDDLLRLKQFTKKKGKSNMQTGLFVSVLSTVLIAGLDDPNLVVPVALPSLVASLFFVIKGVDYHKKAERYNDRIIEKLVKERK